LAREERVVALNAACGKPLTQLRLPLYQWGGDGGGQELHVADAAAIPK